MKTCPVCAKKNGNSLEICTSCGSLLPAEPDKPARRTKKTEKPDNAEKAIKTPKTPADSKPRSRKKPAAITETSETPEMAVFDLPAPLDTAPLSPQQEESQTSFPKTLQPTTDTPYQIQEKPHDYGYNYNNTYNPHAYGIPMAPPHMAPPPINTAPHAHSETRQLPPPVSRKKFDSSNNWAAITSLVLGIISVPCCFTVFWGLGFGALALVFGIIGAKSEKRSCAISGIVLGSLSLLSAILLVVGIMFFSTEVGFSQVYNFLSRRHFFPY